MALGEGAAQHTLVEDAGVVSVAQPHYRLVGKLDCGIVAVRDFAYEDVVVAVVEVEGAGKAFVAHESLLAVCDVVFGASERLSGNCHSQPAHAVGHVVECAPATPVGGVFRWVDVGKSEYYLYFSLKVETAHDAAQPQRRLYLGGGGGEYRDVVACCLYAECDAEFLAAEVYHAFGSEGEV